MGRVLTFDPPHVLAFSWDIGPDWQIVADLDGTSTVEVTFEALAEEEGQTRVVLVHRHIERHGAGWEILRDGVDAPDGWPLYLDRDRALTGEGGSDGQA